MTEEPRYRDYPMENAQERFAFTSCDAFAIDASQQVNKIVQALSFYFIHTEVFSWLTNFKDRISTAHDSRVISAHDAYNLDSEINVCFLMVTYIV